MSTLTLYQFPISHYCEKIRWALDYKNVVHQKKTLLPGMHVKKMLKHTGQSSVPVIKHKDSYQYNSINILDYLDVEFPDKPLTPTDPDHKQTTSHWERFADENIGPQVRTFLYHHLLDEPDTIVYFFSHNGPFYAPFLLKKIYPKLEKKMRKYMNINEQTAQQAKQTLDSSIDTLLQELQGREFLVGDHFSRADLAVASLLAPLLMPKGYGLDKPELAGEFKEILNTYEQKLEWVSNLYTHYR